MKHAICPSCGELSAKELLKVIPTDGSIAEIYKRFSPQKKVESSIPTWGCNRMEPAPTLFARLADYGRRKGFCS